jgi:chromosome segregation ATPase
MEGISVFITILKDIGMPTITVVGFAVMMLALKKLENKVSADMAKFDTNMEKLEARVSADIAVLKADVTGLKTEMSGIRTEMSGIRTEIFELKSDVTGLSTEMLGLKNGMDLIKGNHLFHIEQAIKELAKGTPNEEEVNKILSATQEMERRITGSEQVKFEKNKGLCVLCG